MNVINEDDLFSIFYPSYIKRRENIRKNDIKFVQYTSAEVAASIIKNEEIWLRNTQCMNDSCEIRHGLNCLRKVLSNKEIKNYFCNTIDRIFPEQSQKLFSLFEKWVPIFLNRTYIACFSEHPIEENHNGRLSMWRGYGNSGQSVALVLNTKSFFSEAVGMNAFTFPVEYEEDEYFSKELIGLTERISDNIKLIEILGKNDFVKSLFYFFLRLITSVKHPGFKEEKEWRIVYCPDHLKSEIIQEDIFPIHGTPQRICKIKFKNRPENNFTGVTIPEILNKIIIGPNEQHNQIVSFEAFQILLSKAGCSDIENKIKFSEIPYRKS